MSHDPNAAKHPEINSTANRPTRGVDEADINIRLNIKLDKTTRSKYQYPNMHAVDCLRQDVAAYQAGDVSLAELIEHSGIIGIQVLVAR